MSQLIAPGVKIAQHGHGSPLAAVKSAQSLNLPGKSSFFVWFRTNRLPGLEWVGSLEISKVLLPRSKLLRLNFCRLCPLVVRPPEDEPLLSLASLP
jgi:hypothetical protein